MFKNLKRCLTAFIAGALAVSAVGCTTGQSTKYVMSVDGFDLKAGVYIYYQNTALKEAKNLAFQENNKLDLTDNDALEEAKIDGEKFLDYVHKKTIINCREHIAIIKKFDEMGLTIDEKDVESAEEYAASIFDDAEAYEEYTINGIGEESFVEIMINIYKATAVFEAIYGEGGTENVQESTVKDNFINTNARVKYVELDLHDVDGNDLDEAGKTEVKNLANKFLNTVKGAADEKDMLQKFNEISDEYDAFVAEKSAEASGEEVTTTTAAEESTDTTTTTVAPYENESIIAIVTTDEDTKEEDLTYEPSKAFHDWAYNDATKLGVPEIIEDSESGKLYVAVKLDIEERMTEDDLWSEAAADSERFSMYSDELQANIDDWVAQLYIKINQDAVERYQPFDYEVPESATNAYDFSY